MLLHIFTNSILSTHFSLNLPAENLLRKRDALPKNTLDYVSYNPRRTFKQLRRVRESKQAQQAAANATTSSASVGKLSQQNASSASDRLESLKQRVTGTQHKIQDAVKGTAQHWLSELNYYAFKHDEFRLDLNFGTCCFGCTIVEPFSLLLLFSGSQRHGRTHLQTPPLIRRLNLLLLRRCHVSS
jgi:hypothetical protein